MDATKATTHFDALDLQAAWAVCGHVLGFDTEPGERALTPLAVEPGASRYLVSGAAIMALSDAAALEDGLWAEIATFPLVEEVVEQAGESQRRCAELIVEAAVLQRGRRFHHLVDAAFAGPVTFDLSRSAVELLLAQLPAGR